MTRHVRRLRDILARLAALQKDVTDETAVEDMEVAKRRLLNALRKMDR